MRRPTAGRVLAAVCAALMLLTAGPLQSAQRRARAAEEAAPAPSPEEYAAQAEKSVDHGLVYLAAHQIEDGSFDGGAKGNTAVTSLCIMAFLAKGHTPGVGPYGNVIDKGIDFVVGSVRDNGLLLGTQIGSGPMYSHSISTLFLSEVSGMVDPERQKHIDAVLPRALEVILAAQKVQKPAVQQGGWRYHPSSRDSDISCTGWPLMALRSARNNGAAVPADAIAEGIKFVLNCRTRNGGFAYQPGGGAGLARTGTGLLCLELTGHHGEQATTQAGDWILQNPQRNPNQDFFYYGLYYSTQGMFQLGGDYWAKFAPQMYDTVLGLQRQDGSWPPGASSENRPGSCYATAMSVLALSVPDAQLPIYQR